LPPTFGDLLKFKANVDGKLDSSRGPFVSIAGFDDNQLEHFLLMPRGGRNNVILVDAQDLIAILEGRISLPDALIAKSTQRSKNAGRGTRSGGDHAAGFPGR
jgi:hypothetical protein